MGLRGPFEDARVEGGHGCVPFSIASCNGDEEGDGGEWWLVVGKGEQFILKGMV